MAMRNLLKRGCFYRLLCGTNVFLQAARKSSCVTPTGECCWLKLKSRQISPDVFSIVNDPHMNTCDALNYTKLSEIPELASIRQPVSKTRIENIILYLHCTDSIDKPKFEILCNIIEDVFLQTDVNGRVHLMNKLMKSIEKRDIFHYNCLLRVYLNLDADFSFANYWTDMICDNVKPNAQTYSTFIKIYCHRGLMEKVMTILDKAKENEELLTYMLIGYAKAGDFKKVDEIFHRIKDSYCTQPMPTHVYIAMMCTYVLRNDLKNVEDIYKKYLQNCSLKSSYFTDQFYCLLASQGHPDTALKYLQKFNTLKVTQNYKLILNFLLKLIDIGQDELAIKLLPELYKICTESEESQSICQYIFLQKLFSRTSDLAKSYKLMLPTLSLNPSFEFQLLQRYRQDNDFDGFKRFIDVLASQKEHNLKSVHFWPLLAHYNSQMNLVGIFSVIEYMIYHCGIVPCFDTLKEFVLPCVQGTPYFENMIRSYNIPDQIFHNANAYVILNQTRIRKADLYMKRNSSVIYQYSLLFTMNVYALIHTYDTQSFIQICKFLHSPVEGTDLTAPEPIENQIIHAFQLISNNKTVMTKMLERLVSDKLVLPLDSIQFLKQRTRGHLQASQLLRVLENYSQAESLGSGKQISTQFGTKSYPRSY